MTETSYEDALGDAFEQLLGEGASDLEQLAEGLNRLGVAPPGGSHWTPELLAGELKRLAA